MRSIGLLITRLIFGSYLAVHGAQKLFGSFGGHGLDATGAGFESMGMKPGKVMATIAGASELGGGVLTAAGIADPLGPLAIAGTMVVASTVHRKQGPLSTNGGFELPLTNFAVATALLASGPGSLRLGPHLSKSLTRLSVVGGAALAGYSLNQLLRAQPAPEEAEDEELIEPS
ncbi:MAG: DoxX family protein [Acidimicrobiales bacterium]|jgi:putative oxidoreductase